MILAAIPAVILILVVLLDVFEVIVLPRRIGRRWRLARVLFRSSWRVWVAACGLAADRRRATAALRRRGVGRSGVVPFRLRALVGGPAGESPLVSGIGALPLAA